MIEDQEDPQEGLQVTADALLARMVRPAASGLAAADVDGLVQVVLMLPIEWVQDWEEAVKVIGDFHDSESTTDAVFAGIIMYARDLERDL